MVFPDCSPAGHRFPVTHVLSPSHPKPFQRTAIMQDSTPSRLSCPSFRPIHNSNEHAGTFKAQNTVSASRQPHGVRREDDNGQAGMTSKRSGCDDGMSECPVFYSLAFPEPSIQILTLPVNMWVRLTFEANRTHTCFTVGCSHAHRYWGLETPK